MYVPGEPRPGARAIRVIELSVPRLGRGTVPELHASFRARCDRCGWLGRPRETRTAALRSADGHPCFPVAGGVAVPVSDVLRIPWLHP